MGIMSIAEDVLGLGLEVGEEGLSKAYTAAEIVGDGTAAAYDYFTGNENAEEHEKDVAWDVASLLPFGAGTLVSTTKTGKDIVETVKDDPPDPLDQKPPDETAEGLKYGAMWGLPWGPAGLIGGALVGGLLGHELEPNMEGGAVPLDFGSQAAEAANQGFLAMPPEPAPDPTPVVDPANPKETQSSLPPPPATQEIFDPSCIPCNPKPAPGPFDHYAD